MKSRMTMLLLLLQLPLTVGVVAQQSSPQTPEDAFTTRDLIAWSQLQAPQPAPQPLPPKDPAVPQPEPPKDQQPNTPVDPHQQQAPPNSYTEPGRTVPISNR